MRHAFPASLMLAAVLCAQQPALAADVAAVPSAPPVIVGPVPAAVVPAATACWRYGTLGWGWYPCYAGPPAYWHSYRGWRPRWARQHWLFYR
jgi:hypothetical protein